MGRVSCQIEKNVDPIRADLFRQPLVTHANDVAPAGCGGLETTSHVVVDDAVGVTHRLLLFLPEALHDTDQKIADRMPPQIGRDEAQSKLVLAIAGVIMRPEYAERRGVTAIVLGMSFGQCGRRYARDDSGAYTAGCCAPRRRPA